MLASLICNVPKVVSALTPPPTPAPPPPTPTPRPLVELPQQQRHYDAYRVYHFMYEYRICYRAYVQPPASSTDAAEQPTPEQNPPPAGSASFHSTPRHGLMDGELEDHILAGIGGATRWLIERYNLNGCQELRQFAIFPGRLTWLHRYSGE